MAGTAGPPEPYPFRIPQRRVERIGDLVALHVMAGLAKLLPPLLWALPWVAAALVAFAALLHWPPSLESLGLAMGLAALSVALREAMRPGATIRPLGVPKALAEAGLSGEVVAARLLDATMRSLQGVVARGVANPLQPLAALPKLELPGIKLTPEALGDLLRLLVGLRRPEISGEIVQDGAAGTLTLRLRGLPGAVMAEVKPMPANAPDRLIDTAAEPLLLRVAPYNLGFTRLRLGDLDAAMRAATMGAANGALRSRVRARCQVLRWAVLLSDGEREQAAAALAEAEALTPLDPLVIYAIAEHIRVTRNAPPEVAEHYARLGRAARFWTRDSLDFEPVDISMQSIGGYLARASRRLVQDSRRELGEAIAALKTLRPAAIAGEHPEIVFLRAERARRLLDSARDAIARAQAPYRDRDGRVAAAGRRLAAHHARLAAWFARLDPAPVEAGRRSFEERPTFSAPLPGPGPDAGGPAGLAGAAAGSGLASVAPPA